MVLLIGNYSADQQQSMQRFGEMMLRGLTTAGIQVELARPLVHLGNYKGAGRFVEKWLGYIDKFLWFPLRLKWLLAKKPAVVHICDHSNAMYIQRVTKVPVVVTCHDLLAVRGALGEDTDCPASFTGRILQRWILSGLRHASTVACISKATAADAKRLVAHTSDRPRFEIVPLGLNYPYQKVPPDIARDRLAQLPVDANLPFVIHVGSNQPRKNRDGVMRIFAQCKDRWDGRLIFAGDPLNSELLVLADQLGIAHRITQIKHPNSATLETLYNCATALLYPSRFEGFGWPIIEAQACGCPVICGDSGPLPEAAGDAGMFHNVADEDAFAADLICLTNPETRAHWSEKSLANAKRFSTEKMIGHYIDIYRSLGATL